MVATISMETNIALGLFVNSTQLLFRMMGAPPCHNNSLKEEQFNVNNIFSICLFMKTLWIHQGKASSHTAGEVRNPDFAKSAAYYLNCRRHVNATLNGLQPWHSSICFSNNLLHTLYSIMPFFLAKIYLVG